MKKLFSFIFVIVTMLMPFALYGGEGFASNRSKAKPIVHKKLLILNSYHADEEWSSNVSRPVEMFMLKNDTVSCDIEYLNNASVKSIEDYNDMCENLFERYQKKHPSYLVLIGNFAFTLRDKIVERWGNIPMVLVSRVETYAPLEEYFADVSDSTSLVINQQKPLGSLRSEYNFTSVIVPDYYSENIDLMMRLIPNMNELVFVSDISYVNRVAAQNLESVLNEKYPHVGFKWLQGSQKNSHQMYRYLTTREPEKGFLLSSWAYEVTTVRGQDVLTSQDLAYLPMSVNPIFTMRQHYLTLGCVGGVFADAELIRTHINNMMESMLKGEDLSKIPFYIPDKNVTHVDYLDMERHHLSLKKLPKDAVVLNQPKNWISKYGHWLLISLLTLIIMTAILWNKSKMQRKQIKLLERHTGFVNNLPMPYTKATLWLDKDNNVLNISYGIKNNAYEELINNNSMPDNPLHLFNNTFLSEIAQKLVRIHQNDNNKNIDSSNRSVVMRHHFKRTNLYCYFIFVPIEQTPVDMRSLDSEQKYITSKFDIDVFAIDMTKDHLLQQQLKDQAITIDISMEMAQLVPWQWDFEKDILNFFTYNKYIGITGLTAKDGKSTSVIKFEDFIRLLHPDDVESFKTAYNNIRRGETSKVDMEFRIRRADEEGVYDWCENHGVVTDTDSDGLPLRMTGSFQYITDRKKQQEQMAEALQKAQESDMLKSAFLANMSHEIRTPLNAIVGFSNLLTTTDNMQERKEFAEIINRNNELLLSLINDILDLAKIESNTITLSYDICDIHDLVASISKTVSIRVPKGVKLNVVHFAENCTVKADAAHVSQVLINLLTNATKFTKRGSITVGYEVFDDENKLFFYVKDTGIGIKRENLDKVFNRFVKLNNFVQGSGLGLAICRTLVEKMGGEIGVESAGEGRGCQFWFTIPYDPQEPIVEDRPKLALADDYDDEPAKKEEVKETKAPEAPKAPQAQAPQAQAPKTPAPAAPVAPAAPAAPAPMAPAPEAPKAPEAPAEKKEEDDILVRSIYQNDNIIGEKSDRPAKIDEIQHSSSVAASTPGVSSSSKNADMTQDALNTIPDGLTVLVAEDNPSNYWLMERLMKNKFKLHHAENGRIAIEMQREVKPDIIVMDINMPDMDGYQSVEAMRKEGVKVPIIAVTAYAFASDRIRILNSGFDAFVSKPVSATLLYDTIAEVWERRRKKQSHS